MKDFNKMSTSQLDKLLLDYVLEGKDSFYSDKELAEMKSVANSLLKELLPNEDPKEIERSNGEFLDMLNEEQARRKLEKEAAAKREQTIGGYGVLNEATPRRVIVDENFDKNNIYPGPFELPYILKKKQIEWKSEFGSKFEEGYTLTLQAKTPNPVMTREQVRELAKYFLAATNENVQRNV